jgi:hypothetical protein
MPTANDEILDRAISHAVDTEKYSNSVVRKIIALLNVSNERLAIELQAAILKAPKTRFNIERLESLLLSVNSLLKESFYLTNDQLQLELEDFTKYEVSFQAMTLQDALPAFVNVGTVTGEQVFAVAMSRPFQGVMLKDALNGISETTQRKIKQTISAGIIEGRTTDQIVREIIGTRANKYADGLMQKSRRDVEAVVRSSISHVAAYGREAVSKKNEDIIKAVKWLSTIDLRTSPECRIRDDKIYTPVTHKPIGHKIGIVEAHQHSFSSHTRKWVSISKAMRISLPLAQVLTGKYHRINPMQNGLNNKARRGKMRYWARHVESYCEKVV